MVNLKISIITINYNNKSGLEKTIESVLQQTYDNIEYLVIDGNSTDGSKDVIKNINIVFLIGLVNQIVAYIML